MPVTKPQPPNSTTRITKLRVLFYVSLGCILLLLANSLYILSFSNDLRLTSQVEVIRPTPYLADTWPCVANNSCRFAYAFYATRREYLCSALVNAHQLRTRNLTLDSIPIIILHISTLEIPPELKLQAERLNVTFREVPSMPSHDGFYRDVLVKLRIWQMTDFDRVIYLDSDIQILRNLDHLFLLPPTELAVPRAYWLHQPFFTSIMLVITPSEEVFKRLSDKYIPEGKPQPGLFDMDLLNKEFVNHALILPNLYGALDVHMKDNDPNPWKDHDALLHRDAFILHFSGGDKPWYYGNSRAAIQNKWPKASPTFYEFRLGWWQLAHKVCYWKLDA